MESNLREPNHLKSTQMAAILSKTFEICTCLNFEWSGFQMVGTKAIVKDTAQLVENLNLGLDQGYDPLFGRSIFEIFLTGTCLFLSTLLASLKLRKMPSELLKVEPELI